MHAGAGDLAARVEAGDRRLPVEVRHDAAHLVVGGRRDGHAAREQVGAGLAQTGDDVGEAARNPVAVEALDREVDRPAALELRVDGAGDDVARREVALRVDALHDAAPVRRSTRVAPSPRSASVSRKPSRGEPAASAVGWNCTNSTSATRAPAR